MVQFTLPKSSRPTPGSVWPKPAGARRLMEFRICRWNPEDGANSRIDAYCVDRHDFRPIGFDAVGPRALWRVA